MGIKDDIAAGPKFEPELMTWDNQGVPMKAEAYKQCAACGDQSHRDVETGLCVGCWRVHSLSHQGWVLSVLFPGERWGLWRRKDGKATPMSMSIALIEDAGGVRRLLEEWEPEA